jgi:hypothetical protein
VLPASQLVGECGGSDDDVFTADKAWWFITLLTHRLPGQPWPG